MFRSNKFLAAIAFFSALGACGGGDSPTSSPANITVTAGDGRTIVRWTQESDLDYWIFRARATSITRENYSTFPEANIDAPVNTPRVVSGLTNDETYSFVMNSTKNSGPAGPSSSSISAVPRLAGGSWNALSPLTGGANSNDVIFADGKFFAVGDGATIFEGIETIHASDNASNTISWTRREVSGFSENLRGITTNSGATQFVVVGTAGKVLSSDDGVTWSSSDISGSETPNLNSITFGAGIYVAVGEGGKIFTSGDAATWNERVSATSVTLNRVAFLSNLFITVGAGGFIATSSNGIDWEQRASGVVQNLNGAAFGSSKFVIVGDAGTVLVSDDGVTWDTATSGVTQNLNDVHFGSRFVGVGSSSTVIISNTGDTGTLQWSLANGNSGDLFATAFGLGANVAVGGVGSNSYSW